MSLIQEALKRQAAEAPATPSESSPPAGEPAAPSAPDDSLTSRPAKPASPLWILLLLLIVIGGGGGGIWWLLKSQPHDQTDTASPERTETPGFAEATVAPEADQQDRSQITSTNRGENTELTAGTEVDAERPTGRSETQVASPPGGENPLSSVASVPAVPDASENTPEKESIPAPETPAAAPPAAVTARPRQTPAPAAAQPRRNVDWPQLQISGVMTGSSNQRGAVFVNSQVIGIGETISGAKLIAVMPQKAEFEFQGERRIIRMGQSNRSVE